VSPLHLLRKVKMFNSFWLETHITESLYGRSDPVTHFHYFLSKVQIYDIVQGVPLTTERGTEDIATKFKQEYVRCVRNEEECVCSVPDCCDTEQRSASQW